jgi:tetratricopeptide (TPR) repeat protein
MIAVFCLTSPNCKAKGAMSYFEFCPSFILRMLIVACLLSVTVAYADDYADVNQLIRAEKLNEAMVKADAYLVSKPRDPQMRFLKGVIQRISGKQTEAISTFTKLTEDFPELPEPYNNLAVLYAGQNQFEKARSALEMAIKTNPSYTTAHENLGDVYARLASQAYGSALQLGGANAAVPPKLALIKEVFKPNLNSQSSAIGATALALAPPAPAKARPSIQATSAATPAMAPALAALGKVPSSVKPAVEHKPISADPSSAEVKAAVIAWAKAWSAKDISGYLGAYTKDFASKGSGSHAAWVVERKKRILGKSSISVKIMNLTVSVNGNKASAKFHQVYKANALTVKSRKTLSLVKSGSEWLITKELTGG